MIESFATVSGWQWLVFIGIVFAAGFIRGLTGFGFSALCFFALGFFLTPLLIVPLVFLLEVSASIRLLPRVYADIPWPWLIRVSMAACCGIPLGMYLLHHLSASDVRQSIGWLVMLTCMTLLLASRKTPKAIQNQSFEGVKKTPKERANTLFNSSFVVVIVGFVSGVANGIAAVGGLVVAVYSLATPLKMVQLRAGLIGFFLIIDLFGLAWLLLAQGDGKRVLPMDLLILAGLSFPVMMFGNSFGFRYFDLVKEEIKRRISLGLLFFLAMLAAIF